MMRYFAIPRLTFAWSMIAAAAVVAADEPIDFDRDIRPILSDHCFQCHGPDEASRDSELRLDTSHMMTAVIDGRRVVEPGDPAASELYRRISATDQAERMPPPDAERPLSAAQIESLRKWIEQGAQWQQHWAFVPPARPDLPHVQDKAWLQNPIDAFVKSRLEAEGLTPQPPADKTTLLRRVTLDLTGLPPTPTEIAAFLADDAPNAYQRVVDRLLASPRYGERMAVPWLDAARYADTSGYQTDGVRVMWRWRDWVIGAMNANMPFDQFTIEQLAGDLLPDPTLDQLIATGFNRNHRANSEGGIVFEEYLAEYAVDRVETTFAVWQGITIGCARCHDHKYDPFSQQDFYRLFAFFNNLPERGRVIKYGNSAPMIKSPTALQQRRLQALRAELTGCRRHLRDLEPEIGAAQQRWEANLEASNELDWTISDNLLVHFPFDDTADNIARSTAASEVANGSDEIDADDKDSPPAGADGKGPTNFVDGPVGQAAVFDGVSLVQSPGTVPLAGSDEFSIAFWIHPEQTTESTILSLMNDEDSRDNGFSIDLTAGKIRVQFGPRWLDDAIRLQSREAIAPNRWTHVAITYDGTQMADGLRLWINGNRQPADVLLDIFTGTFSTEKYALRIGPSGRDANFSGKIDDVRIYRRQLSPLEVGIASCSATITEIAALPVNDRTPQQQAKINQYFLRHAAPASVRELDAQIRQLHKALKRLDAEIPTTMIMAERPEPAETFVLRRGEYDKPGARVERGTPAAMPPLPSDAPLNRLGLARWLVDPANPLTARVAVNRLWQIHFGTGLVPTSEDFGSQGQRPTHPKLLDWLATEFVRTGWDVKAIQRLIVTSATYRQSSNVDSDVLARDPENRLLARASRLRLSGEMVRDQALAVSGLLHGPIGGPSVKPYQPPGLWKEISSDTYQQDSGSALYRRSLYTFWKRTVPPPAMATFDATAREACTIRRSRTNTPLQALALMNDVTYIEAARSLAGRMVAEAGNQPHAQIRFGFRLVTGRSPNPNEMEILVASFQRSRERFAADPKAARQFAGIQADQDNGSENSASEPPVAERAATTLLANLLLNLDETIMRE